MEKKFEIKENYFLGIIGAILGGLIIAIPLAFAYIYSKWTILLAMAVLFPLFEFYGYKWFKGKINAKLPIILLIVTVVNVLIMTLLFIPIALLIKSKLPITPLSIKSIYVNTRTALTIVQDCLLSLVISMLGVYIVSEIIKRKLLLNISNINLFSSDVKESIDLKEKAIEVLKPIFEKNGAIQKQKTISKEEVLSDIKSNHSGEYFAYLRQLNIIKRYKGKYYYSQDNEKNIKQHYQVEKLVGVIVLTAILVVIISFSFRAMINRNTKKIYNNDVSFSIDNSWNSLQDYTEETGWIYYKKMDEDSKQGSSSSLYPETIGVIYDNSESTLYKSINDLKSMLELYLNNSSDYDEYDMNIFTTSKGYEAIELALKYGNITEIDYYIYNEGKIAYVTAISYTSDEEVLEELEEYSKDVANSFEWN